MLAVFSLASARASSPRVPAYSPASVSPTDAGSPASSEAPLDVTAETTGDTDALGDAAIRRVLMLAAKQSEVDQETQVRLDRMRSEFDNAQAERAELMREANVLRDMAMEQQKRDDEILKKWIALI